MKSYSVATFKIEGQTNSIRMTKHALERLEDRKISKNVVISHILDLSKDEYLFYQDKQAELVLLYLKEKLAIVVAFEGNKLIVETEITFEKEFWFKDDFVKFVH